MNIINGQGVMCIPSIMSGLESPEIDIATASMHNLVIRTRHDDSVLTEIDVPLVIRNVLRVLPFFPIRLDPGTAASASRTTSCESGIAQADKAFYLLAKMAEHYPESEPNRAVSTIVSSGGIPLLVDHFRVLSVQTSHLLEIRMEVVRNIARIICAMTPIRREPMFREFCDAGIIPCLVEAIKVRSRAAFSAICTPSHLRILNNLACGSRVRSALIFHQGAAPLLLQLVASVPEMPCKEAALNAFHVLLDSADLPCCDLQFFKAEGLDILIKALRDDHDAATDKVQAPALLCIKRLIMDLSRRNEIIRRGLLPHLVRKLKHWPGPVTEILRILAQHTSCYFDKEAHTKRCATIVNEGAVLPLVEQLTADAISRDPDAAMETIHVLCELGRSNAHSKIILETLSTQKVHVQTLVELVNRAQCTNFGRQNQWLQNHLRTEAESKLFCVVQGNQVDQIEDALEKAEIAGVYGQTITYARDRVAFLKDEAHKARLARLERVGLAEWADMPEDYMCPITREVFRDPVVASDGNTYERSAIEAVLEMANPLSPLTREPLIVIDALFPNRALRKRIADHEGEIDQMATNMEARMAEAAAEATAARSAAEAEAASLRQQLEELKAAATAGGIARPVMQRTHGAEQSGGQAHKRPRG